MALSKPKIWTRIHKERDLDLLVRTQSVLGTEFVELRDFIPSTKTESRGVLIEKRLLPQVIEALQDLQQHFGTSGRAGVGQGVLDGVG